MLPISNVESELTVICDMTQSRSKTRAIEKKGHLVVIVEARADHAAKLLTEGNSGR
jgi:hypothetical protein